MVRHSSSFLTGGKSLQRREDDGDDEPDALGQFFTRVVIIVEIVCAMVVIIATLALIWKYADFGKTDIAIQILFIGASVGGGAYFLNWLMARRL
jgi:hypothetical protein